MHAVKHAVSIGTERFGDEVFVSVKAVGRLTHEDYQTFTPLFESAIEGLVEPKVKVLIDGTEWEGWTLGAAWDDCKLGLKHGKDFDKIAIYGNKNWQEIAAKVGSWFVSGTMRYFEHREDAVRWLAEG